MDPESQWLPLSGFLTRSESATMSRHPYLGRYGAFEAALQIWIRIIVGSKICFRIKVKNSRAMEAQNGELKGPGRSQWRRGGLKWSLEGQHVDQLSLIAELVSLWWGRIRIQICSKVKRSVPDPNQSEKSQPDQHQSEKSDPNPHQSEKSDPDRHQRDADLESCKL